MTVIHRHMLRRIRVLRHVLDMLLLLERWPSLHIGHVFYLVEKKKSRYCDPGLPLIGFIKKARGKMNK